MNMNLCMCGPRAPVTVQVVYDRAARDPRGQAVHYLEARFRAEGDRRWRLLAQTIRQALIEHDLLGLKGVGRLPHENKVEGWASWLRGEVGQKLLGFDGTWTAPFVENASREAQRAAGGIADPSRIKAIQALAVSELRGIASVAEQQLTRAVAHHLSCSSPPYCTANALVPIIWEMRNRTRAMAAFVVAKAHASATLVALRNLGATHVDLVPERVRQWGKDGAGEGLFPISDAPRKSGPGSRGGTSARTVRRIKAVSRKLKKVLPRRVDVLTAGDDEVCPRCEQIADDGPYTLAQAEGLIPAHNYCRCTFVRAGTVRDAGPPDEPRDPRGRWTSGGGYLSPTNDAVGFIAARDKSSRPEFLSHVTAEDLKNHTLLMNADHTVGAAVSPDGDIQNVFNNGGPKGAGALAMAAAIDRGGRVLDCYDGHLNNFYHQLGFEETGRMTFNPEFAPWYKPGMDQPDVVFMAWKGWPASGRDAAIKKAMGRDGWDEVRITDHRETDWDAAKQRSRSLAVHGGRAQDHRGELPRAEWSDPGEGGLHPRSGARDWQSVDFNPYHLPGGSPEGGQFTSGPSGGAAAPEYVRALAKIGAKKKAEISDFVKADVTIDSSTRSDPKRQEKFLQQWNDKVDMPPEQFKHDFLGGLPSTMGIRYQEYDNTLHIQGNLLSESNRTIGEYVRKIDLDKNKASSEYFKLYGSEQGHNIGKEMLAANVAMYQKLGLDKVAVHANIDVGGYAWAKYGYVPTRGSWSELSDKIERRLTGGGRRSGGGSGEYPGSWDEMSSDQQDEVEREFMRQTESEFIDSEIENWRDSGDALHRAKEDLAGVFDERGQGGTIAGLWAHDALDQARDWSDKPIPFDDKQLLDAIEMTYSDRYGDGRADPDITWNDDKLTNPKGYVPAQGTLPGFEPVKPHEYLTEDMRSHIETALVKKFNAEAESNAADTEPPDYIRENVSEYQREYWDGLGDHERFNWADRNGVLPEIEYEPEEDEEEVEVDKDTREGLLALAHSSDPKAVWAIADSKRGKELLLNSDWYGELNLKDKETMDRFNAYVAKRKK